MPRLINEDKAKEVLTDYYHIHTTIQQIALEEAFSRVPTVEAITVKWIKNYASHKASKDLIDCYWHFWEDDVLKMVADWERKNANDKEKEV